MKKTITLLTIVVIVTAVYSCKKNKDTLATTAYLDLPATPYLYSRSTFDTVFNHRATLGRVLFYDTRLSLNNAVSCGSCHKQSLGFADNVAFSKGYEGRLTKRNSIGLTDMQLSSSFFWDGRESNIFNLALRPITNHVEMGIEDYAVLTTKLAAIPYYNQLFKKAFGDETIDEGRIANSIATFMRCITADNSRLDQFDQGNRSVLTAQEMQGRILFDTKYNCGSCHNNGSSGGGGYNGGNGFTFLDIGLDNGYSDEGRGTITGMAETNGTFRVPNLRNVALTAPYMHDGRYKTLDDVLEHYSHGIANSPNLDIRLKDSTGHAMHMNITDGDKKAIIAFLGTLTDYTVTIDPKFSNPFKVK